MKSLLNLLQIFKDDSKDKELEIRLYIDPRQHVSDNYIIKNNDSDIKEVFNRIIDALLKESVSTEITTTIELIREHKDRSKKRLAILFPGKVESYMTKKELLKWNENGSYGNYKVSISSEIDDVVDETMKKDFTKIRIKLRLSIVIKLFPDWRYDITFVKTLHKIENLQKQKNALFIKNITSVNFNKKAPYLSADHIEFEAEYIGTKHDISPLDVSKVVNTIYSIIDPSVESMAEYQDYLNLLAPIILGNYNPNGLILKKLYNSVKELSKAVYFDKVWPQIENWWLTDKADGQRCLIVASSSKIILVSDHLYLIKCPAESSSTDELTIIDAELVYAAKNISRSTNISPIIKIPSGKTKPILFTFDVIMYKGEKLAHKVFGERFKKLHEATKLINDLCKQTIAELKVFVRLTKKNYVQEIRRIYNQPRRPYDIDGLIFTPDGPSETDIIHNEKNKYNQKNTTYKNMEVWKWKPVPTIDFLLRKPSSNIAGKSPYLCKDSHTLYFLFSGINRQIFERMNIMTIKNYFTLFGSEVLQKHYHPIQFSPSSNPLAYIYCHPNKIKLKTLEGGAPKRNQKNHLWPPRILESKHAPIHSESKSLGDEDSDASEDDILDVTIHEPSYDNYDTEVYGFDMPVKGKSETSKENLDGKIGEFKLLIDEKTGTEEWQIIKIRTDRTQDAKRGQDFGNDFIVTAERIWNNFHNPLLFKDLILKPDEYHKKGYFKYPNSDIHKPQRSFNSFVKSSLLRQLGKQIWLVDMGSGKGQDLFRYADNHMRNVLFLDIDPDALSELITRKKIFLTGRQETGEEDRKLSRSKDRKMGIYILEMDLNDNYENNISNIKRKIPIPKEGVPLIICSFTFHYLMKNARQLENIILFIDKIVANDGQVLLLTYDGEKVFHLLKKYNNKYSVSVDGRVKYAIKANYPKTNKLSDIGQTINVLLPFSSGEFYQETLVNVDYIIRKFKRFGFSATHQQSFDKFLPKFKEANPRVYDLMSNDDKEYVGLYQYVLFKKVPKKTKLIQSGYSLPRRFSSAS